MRARISLLAIMGAALAATLALGHLGAGMVETRLAAGAGAALNAVGAPWARVAVDGLTATLSGEAPNAQARDDALAAAKAGAPALAFALTARVAPPPVAPPPHWSLEALVMPGEAVAAGRLAPPLAAAFTEALRAALPNARISGFITPRAAAPATDISPDISAAIAAAARVAAALSHGRVALSEGRFSVEGLATDKAGAERARAEAAALRKAGWTAEAVVSTPEPPELPTEPAAPDVAAAPSAPAPAVPSPSPRAPGRHLFGARTEGPGLLLLTGVTPGARAERSLRAYAAAAFTGRSVETDFTIDDAPARPGWRLAAMTALSALAALEGGSVRVADGVAALTGRAQDPTALRAAHDRLIRSLGPGWRGTSRITLSPARAAAAQPLPIARCARRLADAVSARPVAFDPGAFTLTEDGRAALDALTPTLRRCAGGVIEIGGHTDSQGRETANLSLSRARAEAVLDHLAAAGAPPGLLIARGYGEAQPIASNADEAGRARNRRIEFKVLEATQ